MANGHDPEDPIQEVLQSGFTRDTLFRILGEPSGGVGVARDRRSDRVGGQFFTANDSVAIAPGMTERQTRRVLTHELGHLFDARGSEEAQRLRGQLYQDYLRETSGDERRRRASDTHAFSSPNEHVATAIERAFRVLRGEDELDRQERRIPGTEKALNFIKRALDG